MKILSVLILLVLASICVAVAGVLAQALRLVECSQAVAWCFVFGSTIAVCGPLCKAVAKFVTRGQGNEEE